MLTISSCRRRAVSYVGVVLRKRCSWPLVPEFVATRMQQFFDKLMGKPVRDWMVKGIPAKDKGRDQLQQVMP